MKFTFDYKETLERRIIIEADTLSNAIRDLESRIENEQIVLAADDFSGAEITMPLSENYLPQLRDCGEDVKDKNDLDILIDFW